MPPKRASRKAGAKQAAPATSDDNTVDAPVQDTADHTNGAAEDTEPQGATDAPVEDQPESEAKQEPASQPATDTVASEKSNGEEEPVEDAEAGQSPAPPSQPEAEAQPKSKKRKLSEQPEDEATEEKPAGKPSKKAKPAEKSESRQPTRRSGRGTQQTNASSRQILNFLLSDSATDFCRPEDETKDIEEHGADLKTYSASVLSPFEELLCAVILSRPISHRLGQRTIRTILNDPYSFTTPKSITDAGKDKTLQAMLDAKTQHKAKIAEQIGLIADVVTSKFGSDATDTSLDRLREEGSHDWTKQRELLKESIKGLGDTGLNIFSRRIQWIWSETYPFVDERTARGLDKLGLPKSAEGLRKALEQDWNHLETDDVPGDDKKSKQSRAFVIICERASGAVLERKSEELLEAIRSS